MKTRKAIFLQMTTRKIFCENYLRIGKSSLPPKIRCLMVFVSNFFMLFRQWLGCHFSLIFLFLVLISMSCNYLDYLNIQTLFQFRYNVSLKDLVDYIMFDHDCFDYIRESVYGIFLVVWGCFLGCQLFPLVNVLNYCFV